MLHRLGQKEERMVRSVRGETGIWARVTPHDRRKREKSPSAGLRVACEDSGSRKVKRSTLSFIWLSFGGHPLGTLKSTNYLPRVGKDWGFGEVKWGCGELKTQRGPGPRRSQENSHNERTSWLARLEGSRRYGTVAEQEFVGGLLASGESLAMGEKQKSINRILIIGDRKVGHHDGRRWEDKGRINKEGIWEKRKRV
ncbi:uncharacterized protein BP01DRAFT_112871 [Aspergillus saccharolyticus JOP 1030-1]|uniref:Uncharacterized protein n=1 Tax=Aspergillus saccharolyticus JOP 1030-1 TaxID=1450539 RepID=A0A318ZXH4_9EURO|nr:hypothetical protein BP01DRAFT_112871 [Aspergillus saccharolyticus JOP 1030-1]PYH48800.1 hypothetical protein BP01DRAFT_112871 [Aspergillus saccharolyticus JOP 1030-1]